MVTPRERWSGSVFEPITIAAAVRAMSGTVPVSLPIPSSIPSPWIRKVGSRLASSVAKANGVSRPSTASWKSSATSSASSRSRRNRPQGSTPQAPAMRRRRAGPSGGDGDVGERAAEVGLVAAGVGGVVDGIGADQIDEGLADADQRALAGGCHRPEDMFSPMAGTIIERTVEIDGIGVFLREVEGEGEPTVFVHGNPTSSADWLPFLERVEGPAIAFDLPGWGRSARPDPLAFDGTFGAHANWSGSFWTWSRRTATASSSTTGAGSR